MRRRSSGMRGSSPDRLSARYWRSGCLERHYPPSTTKIRTSDVAGEPDALRRDLERQAHEAGFDLVRIMRAADFPAVHGERLRAFVDAGRHGDMVWMADTTDRRAHPQTLWPEAQSVIVLAMNYGPGDDPMAALHARERAVISCYAKGKDYHVIIKKALKRLAGWLHRTHELRSKGIRRYGARAGETGRNDRRRAGWQGKHTNLVSRALRLVAVSRVDLHDCQTGAGRGGT